MVCFDFGAVVFCNTKNLDVIGQQLVHARGFCERPLEEPSAEEYEVVLDPTMKAWSEISEHNGVGCVRMREASAVGWTMRWFGPSLPPSQLIFVFCLFVHVVQRTRCAAEYQQHADRFNSTCAISRLGKLRNASQRDDAGTINVGLASDCMLMVFEPLLQKNKKWLFVAHCVRPRNFCKPTTLCSMGVRARF